MWPASLFGRKKTDIVASTTPSTSTDKEDSKSTSESSSLESDKPAYLTSKAHHAGKGYYVNPWPSATAKRWLPQSFSIPVAWSQEVHPSVKRVKVVHPDFDRYAGPRDLKVTWLGHAGVLVQLPPLKDGAEAITVCIDPIFSDRSSPSQYAGPARRLPPPCKVDDLPHLDFVLISHNHYDHLDFYTMEKIVKRGGTSTRYVVPLGLKQWFIDSKVPESQIVEQDWWDEVTLQPSLIGDRAEELDDLGSLRISCVPAQHNSARTGFDKSASLWAGFVVEQFAYKPSPAPTRTCIYFAGDTGYRAESGGDCCPAFEQIGERYGPMDFAAMPIWRGGTLSFVSYMGFRLHHEALTLATHATPEDAVSIHSDVQSRASMAIHFATFAGSEDEATYPVSLLEEACVDVGIEMDISKDRGMGVCNIGETVVVPVRQ